ncbi:MAG: GDSL-type esterase/lipase family protein [Rhodospirillales bacterium]|nr:GDSL-type esterase/lipase family protein [Rhodospirillales bacterium]
MTLLARLLVAALLLAPLGAAAQTVAMEHWVTAWTGAAQGPYPSGFPSAQPVLALAFPAADGGAHDQSFRLILRPDTWGEAARLRFSNAYGAQPLTLDAVHVAMQMSGAALMPATSRAVTFDGRPDVTIPPGQVAWSDPVGLDFVPAALVESGRMAVSFHVVGDAPTMTWHAKALTTSYLSRPGAGAAPAGDDSELGFPFTTTSWYFLDAVDMMAAPQTRAIVAFGDSITDGTASTLNGDDRWPDVLARRLHAALGDRVVVVNEGIGGNQVVGPAQYGPGHPFPGGPAALQRLDRDILGLSGVGTVIVMEGINDLGSQGNASAEAVEQGMKQLVARVRSGIPGVRVIGATLTPALGSSNPAHGSAAEDTQRQAVNAFIRSAGLFDAVLDFDAVTRDPASGQMRAEFVPESTTGGAGDKLHPNRAGYQAMAASIPLAVVLPAP